MLQQKRIRKPPEPIFGSFVAPAKRPKRNKMKKKIKRCTYQTIPCSSKLMYSTKIFSLYGGITILEHNNRLLLELSLLNRFMTCREIQVICEESDLKLMSIKLDKKELKIQPWNQVVKTLKNLKDPHLAEWAKIVTDFSEEYAQSFEIGDPNLKLGRENSNISPTIINQAEIEAQRLILLKSNPCICLKTDIEDKKNVITEIVLTESFIQELGYDFDSFASLVLKDGIPQLMPYDQQANSKILKDLLENYSHIQAQSYQSTELSSSLFTKGGIKNITFQMSTFPRKSEEKHEIDIILAILKVKKPSKEELPPNKQRINKSYTDRMLCIKDETDFFLSSFYAESLPLARINPEKVCRIKEISSDFDEIFCEKNESVKSEHS